MISPLECTRRSSIFPKPVSHRDSTPSPPEVGGAGLTLLPAGLLEVVWDEQLDATAYNIYAGDLSYMRQVGRADLRTDPSASAFCDPVTFGAGPGRVGSDVDPALLPAHAYLLITAVSPGGESSPETGTGGILRDVDAASCP